MNRWPQVLALLVGVPMVVAGGLWAVRLAWTDRPKSRYLQLGLVVAIPVGVV